MNKTIYMYASLPKKGKAPFGGGEVGNVRTIRMLRTAGYKVVTMRQRSSEAGWGKLKTQLSYPFRMIANWSGVLITMLFASRKCIAHLAGCAGLTIFNEYIIMHIMKKLGFKVVYEIRAGGAIDFWENGSARYRKMFRYMVEKACYVFVQGKENIPLIESICKTPVYHYANCVEDSFVPATLPAKPEDKINLLFYGRCEKDKHLDMIVDAAAMIQKDVPNVYLTIVGNGKQLYIDMIKSKMQTLLKEGSYEFLPGRKHEELPELLMDKHFYIFPSTQPREGQSNSITESMAYGIIPIASPQGFNRSTIGNDYYIIDELNADKYAERIIEIIKSGMAQDYSKQVYEHFQKNYTQEVVFGKTIQIYNSITESTIEIT